MISDLLFMMKMKNLALIIQANLIILTQKGKQTYKIYPHLMQN